MCTSCKVQINGKGGQFYIAANTGIVVVMGLCGPPPFIGYTPG